MFLWPGLLCRLGRGPGCCSGKLVLGNKKTAGLKWPAAFRRMGGVVTARSVLSLVDVKVF